MLKICFFCFVWISNLTQSTDGHCLSCTNVTKHHTIRNKKINKINIIKNKK